MGSLNKTWKLTGDDKAKIADRYRAGESAKEIAVDYGMTKEGICYSLKKSGVLIRDSSHAQQRYGIDEAVFDDLAREEVLWVLGFLTADGSVGQNGALEISLKAEEREALVKIKSIMKSEHQISERIAHIGEKEYPVVRLAITNQKIAARLRELGFVKGRKNVYPDWVAKLTDEQFRHWLRGLWDGDGTVRVATANHGANHYLDVGLCGYRELLKPVRDRLISILGVTEVALVDREKIVTFEWEGSGAVKVARWLYSDATVFMVRKKAVWDEWSNHEN